MKGTNIQWCLLLVLLGLHWVSVAQVTATPTSEATGKGAVCRVDIHVFRLPVDSMAGDEGNSIGGEHALQKFDNGKLVPVLEQNEDTASFGPTVNLSVRGLRWTADKDGLNLPDEKALQESLVEIVARPSILLPVGESAEFRIGGDQPIQYFVETEDDGVFELRTDQKFVGYVFGCTLTPSDETKGALVATIVSAIEGAGDQRRPVPGLSLDVGPPVSTGISRNATVAMRPNDWFVLVQRTWDRRSLVLTLVTIREDRS